MEHSDFIKDLASGLKSRNNPVDLKSCLIGRVEQLEPVIVCVFEGAVQLTEGDELFISEAFRLRCGIDKTGALSSGVPSELESALSIDEIHSFTGAPCQFKTSFTHIANAITKVNTELLQLKCDLKVGDSVAVASLEQTDMYALIDKVL